jgi:outer membrane protein TolC
MMENTRKSMDRNIELNYNLLRFQLGVSPETDIELSNDLDDMMEQANLQSSLEQNFIYQNHIDYRILSSVENMSILTLKTEKSSVLPSLSAYYSYSQNGMGDKLNSLRWFPNSMLGIQLTVPIFSSGQRYSRIKRAEFELEKARTNTAMVTDQLLLQEKQYRYNLVNAMEQYESQKNNVDVARRVYESLERKFREGLASSLDLTQANNNYLLAENNYIASLLDLLQSKLALDKLLNNI